MKKTMLTTLELIFLIFAGCWAADSYQRFRIHKEVWGLTDSQRRATLTSIEARLAPPEGTPLSQVEQVYGKSHGCFFGKMPPPGEFDDDCRAITVLSLFNDPDYGSALQMKVNGDDTVRSAGFAHSGQEHGLKQLALGFVKPGEKKPPESYEMRVQKDIYRRNERVALEHSRLIELVYRRALRRADWQTAE